MVSILLLISNSSNLLSKLLRTVPSAPSTFGITILLIFHSFLTSLVMSKYFFIFLLSFILTLFSCFSSVFSLLFFLLINCRSDRLAGIKRSVCYSKSQKVLRISFSSTDSGLGIYHLVVLSKFSLLHNFQWLSFPTQSSIVRYSFCANNNNNNNNNNNSNNNFSHLLTNLK